jgi:hypothetical protein
MREAANYYEKKDYFVIRLETSSSVFVGKKENLFEDSAKLGKLLREYLPFNEYLKFIHTPVIEKGILALNGVYPENSPISSYPPDFLVINKLNHEWKFVEVKSPKDKISFRQANWYINLMPNNWQYEILALINKDFEDVYIQNDLDKKGILFDEIYNEEKKEVDEFLKHFRKSQTYQNYQTWQDNEYENSIDDDIRSNYFDKFFKAIKSKFKFNTVPVESHPEINNQKYFVFYYGKSNAMPWDFPFSFFDKFISNMSGTFSTFDFIDKWNRLDHYAAEEYAELRGRNWRAILGKRLKDYSLRKKRITQISHHQKSHQSGKNCKEKYSVNVKSKNFN